MIDKIDTYNDPAAERIFSHLHQQALSAIYTDTEPTVSTVPQGKIVIYDNGATRRVYFRTGKDAVGYVTLTII